MIRLASCGSPPESSLLAHANRYLDAGRRNNVTPLQCNWGVSGAVGQVISGGQDARVVESCFVHNETMVILLMDGHVRPVSAGQWIADTVNDEIKFTN